MRSLPRSIPVLPEVRIDGAPGRAIGALNTSVREISKMALFSVIHIRTTGNPQTVEVGSVPGSWFLGAPSNYVRVKEVSRGQTNIVVQADVVGVDLDIIVIF